MKNNLKKISAIVIALGLIFVIGTKMSDYALKASDGTENIVEEVELEDEELSEETDTEDEIDVQSEDTAVVIDGEEAKAHTGSVSVTSNIDINNPVTAGTEVILTANVTGYEDIAFHYQWVKSSDGQNWEVIEDADQSTYSFIMSQETCGYQWKVNLIQD